MIYPFIRYMDKPPSEPSEPKEDKMDENNLRALKILLEKGEEAFLTFCFKDPKDPSRQLTYSEMRELYG